MTTAYVSSPYRLVFENFIRLRNLLNVKINNSKPHTMKTSIIDRGKKINESKTFPFATSFTSLIIIANTKYVPKEPKKYRPKSL